MSTDFGWTTTVLFLIDIQAGSVNGNPTMMTHDPIFQPNLGQRTGASFQDIQVINYAYCNGESSRCCQGLVACHSCCGLECTAIWNDKTKLTLVSSSIATTFTRCLSMVVNS